MRDPQTTYSFNLDNLGLRGMMTQTLYHTALERGWTELASHDIRSETRMLEVEEKVIPEVRTVRSYMPVSKDERDSWQAKLFDMGDLMVFLGIGSTYNWEVMGAGANREKLDELMLAIKDALPAMKSKDPNIVPVNFWSQSPDGVKCRTRRIAVPSWKDVLSNYADKTRKGLEGLMGLWPPIEDNGRLLLWHGVPGTGKSYGIRAMAQSWQKWCEVHYIVDPEKFFGNADYMLQVILQSADNQSSEEGMGVAVTTNDPKAPNTEYTGHPWSLLIMEDSDEFLTADAKERSGQSMSRLLNLTSGFIGQGLNVLVLITTNEPLEHIHKALQREGRCMANVEFAKMSVDESQGWADSKGVTLETEEERTIADLYAITRKMRQVRTGPLKNSKMGFKGIGK